MAQIILNSFDKVTVEAPTAAVESVALNVTQKTLTIGESCTLTATVTPANAANQKVSWTSSNQSVATVDENGKVTSIESGEAVITVTTGDVSVICGAPLRAIT